MKYNLHMGREISTLGYGCMRFPVIEEKNECIDYEKSEKLLLHAIAKGVNYIDTAYVYHGGNSELFVGEFLEKHNLRDNVTLATKLPAWLVKEHADFEKLMDEQLKKLRTDRIDYYLLHSLDGKRFDEIVSLGVFEFMKKAKEDNKVLRWGFSFHDEFESFEKIISSYPWDFCQIQLNYLDENYQAGLKGLELAQSLGIPVIIMEPLKGGRLSNPPSAVADILKEFKGLSPSQIALKYIYSKDNVLTVLSGMNAMEQIDENIAVSEMAGTLSESEANAIEAAAYFYKSREKIGCTGCEYCIPCPVNVAIPNIFSAFNNKYIFDEEDKQSKSYAKLISDNKSATNCVACGQCESICPQNLPIIETLAIAHEDLTK